MTNPSHSHAIRSPLTLVQTPSTRSNRPAPPLPPTQKTEHTRTLAHTHASLSSVSVTHAAAHGSSKNSCKPKKRKQAQSVGSCARRFSFGLLVWPCLPAVVVGPSTPQQCISVVAEHPLGPRYPTVNSISVAARLRAEPVAQATKKTPTFV